MVMVSAMKILALDTSCDESCAAVLDTDRWCLAADIVSSHAARMKMWGGVVPEVASREHLKALPLVIDAALQEARMTMEELNWIAVTNRPGLIGALLVGVSYAKALAFAGGISFTAIDHVEAHLFSPLLATFEGRETPPFPWVALIVSGGHTELFHVEGVGRFRWLGGTLDDAAGEAFDKAGKLLGLAYPAGPLLDSWVRDQGSPSDRAAFKFPRAKVAGLDFSFSGLKTAVRLAVEGKSPLTETSKLSIAASAQEAIVDALVEKTRLAHAQFPGTSLVVTGGVACNFRLREKLPEAHFPAPKHCTDNAAMVALLAGLLHREGKLTASPFSTSAMAQSI